MLSGLQRVNKLIATLTIIMSGVSLSNASVSAQSPETLDTSSTATTAETTATTLNTERETNPGNLYVDYPAVNYSENATQRKLIERGEYLTKVGDCIACHTKPGGKPFAGGLAMNTPFGKFYTPNITPDKETGIGQWTDEQFVRAMQHGVRADGSFNFPVFPYIYFNKVHKQDLLAIRAYLNSIPAVKQKNLGNELPFPLNVRFLQLGWRIMFFYPYKGEYEYDHTRTPQWNRGAYLVEGLGHCGMCHTPLNPLGAPKRSHYLTGGFIDDFWAPNITGLGLDGVPVSEIVNVFTKHDLIGGAGKVYGPMADVDHDSLRYLTNDDLTAMAIYLKTVKSNQHPLAERIAHISARTTGKQVYLGHCAKCHTENAVGAPLIGDKANWQERFVKGLDTLYRHTINGYNAMPRMGDCVTCTPNEVKLAVNYLIGESLSPREQLLALEKAKPVVKIDGQKTYQAACAVCHDSGKNGAPIIGNQAQWQPIIAQGMDIVIKNTFALDAHKKAKAGCKVCSNAEIIAATKYIVQQSKTTGDYSLW
ncbi:MAG: c-type cytochrome [Gammaproteobacteria bacterium]